MFNLREVLNRGVKTRFFVKTRDGPAVHISRLYGSAVRSVIFGRGFIEYTLDNPQSVYELYEVVYSPSLLKTVVYEPVGLKPIKEYSEIPMEFSSGYSFIDRVVAELGVYRRFWAQVLCGTPRQPLDYYVVDATARGAIGYTLHARTKELLQESSREYTGFVLGVLVKGILNNGLSILASTANHCFLAEHAKQVSWTGTKIVLGDSRSVFTIEVEKRMGPVNPDIVVEYSGNRVLIECKTGPPKTWLFKALKQATMYRGVGRAVLVTPRTLNTMETETLTGYYDAIIKCSPENTSECAQRLHQLL